MAGIVGIDCPGKQSEVLSMLEKISHRGKAGTKLLECRGTTLGAVWPEAEIAPSSPTMVKQSAWDAAHPLYPDPGDLQKEWEPFALAAATPQGLFLARDTLGVRPLYYGYTREKNLCFASEVKALIDLAEDIHEFPPGVWYRRQSGFIAYNNVQKRTPSSLSSTDLAAGLRMRLEQAVARRIDHEIMGCWLSGGLDSSVITSLVQPMVRELHTFACGLEGSQDLVFARQVASFLGTQHHEVVVSLKDLLVAIPEVIYHLESFDALLMRSTLTNVLVARRAASYVGSVFSGEGADELFAGYEYLRQIPDTQLPDELLDITKRLHNTALQRVDRSASASGLAVHIPFLDPDLVEYALEIPSRYKLLREKEPVEKWIVRKALEDMLPKAVLWRKKAKFWQGSGVGDLLLEHAQAVISDHEFAQQRQLPNGWTLNTKEELMYYQVFREHFGDLQDLSWMGRTKGSPIQ